MGDGNDLRYNAGRDWFQVSAAGDFDEIWNSDFPDEAMLKACGNLTNPSPEHDSSSGAFWFYAGLADTWYSHMLSPNHRVPDCGSISGMWGAGVISARSAHDQGVNVTFLDGSVRFQSDTIDERIWRSIGTRAGGESDHSD